ncbi:MAG: glucan biosynthesis protein G [Pseudohongiellaceae bacterium]
MVHRGWLALCLSTGLMMAFVSLGHHAMAQPVPESDSRPFSHQWLKNHARELSTRPFTPQDMEQDNPLRSLDYDDYRRIVFDPDEAVWGTTDLPFHLQLFHPGFLHTTPVDIHLVSGGVAHRLPFTTDVFQYHDSLPDIDPADAGGYAGFRVHHPINTTERHEEFLVFLGASYFRGVGRDQFYGLSARGLSVNTVGPGDEEFPRFSAFWIERPDDGAGDIVIHALLDSLSVTGAYRFRVRPGERTRMDVEATLYPRQDIDRVGVAPLTSMFLFDATNRSRFDDFRDAVHDSDGLRMVQQNGEVVWRPLSNPESVQVSSFDRDMPAGFGLLQRHQDFGHFNDAEARYDRRTSLWIEPLDDWGEGHIELLEIPVSEEIHDNIVAYWQPADGLEEGAEYHYRYRMYWGEGAPSGPDEGRVLETAAGGVPGSRERVFVIDYSGGERIPDVISDPAAVRIRATTDAGRITDVSGTLVAATGNYRAYVKLEPGEADLAELRVTLHVGGRQWGETWLYRWTR